MNTSRLFPQVLYAPEGQPNTVPETPASTPSTPPQSGTGDDDDFQEEEVNIDDVPAEGEGGEPAAAETPAAPAPKKRGPKRYAELNRRAQESMTYAQRVQQENQELRERATKAEADAAEANTVAMQTYAAKAEGDLAAAKRAYSEALKSDDADKITEATAALSSAQSNKDDVDRFKRSETKPAAAAPAAPTPAAQQPIRDVEPHIRDWMIQNRYFDHVARDDRGNIIVDAQGKVSGNPDFNEEMHAEAVLYATKLERKIARGELTFQKGSKEYFDAIDEHQREEFPDAFEDDDPAPARPAKAPARGSPVAAPGGRTLPGKGGNGAGQKVTLSVDQVRFITKSVANGGGPRYPKGHPQEFKPMSLPDAKVSYARRLQTQAKEDKQ